MSSIKLALLAALLAIGSYAAPLADATAVQSNSTIEERDTPVNGVWTINDKGERVKTGDLSEPPKEWMDNYFQNRHHRLDRRGKEADGFHCLKNGGGMDEQLVARAIYNLGSMCDNGGKGWLKAKTVQYASYDGVQVYICNHQSNSWFSSSDGSLSCSTDAIQSNVQFALDKCNTREGE